MLILIKLAVFICATAGILFVSWESLHNPRCHGFYRFFAWEAIVALMLLNVDFWIKNPFSFFQIISWLLLIISLLLVIPGFKLLHTEGKPNNMRADEALLGLEKTTELVTAGVYKYIRHPLYSSLLFLTWGAFFKRPSWSGGFLAIIATVFLVATAKMEETENIKFFGSSYQGYMKQTKMFIPFVL